jgi:dolichol-phosphate mannosyltransferase
MPEKIDIVIPLYNEEGNVFCLADVLTRELEKTGYPYTVIFVDDGSSDNTLELLQRLAVKDNRIRYISLSRNFGHQNALKAGLDHADGSCVIMMDGDMQHPPEVLHEMLQKWKAGYDVVYTLRKPSEDIGFMKRVSSDMFYKFMNTMSNIEMEQGSADFRLMDKKVMDVFRQFNESDPFLRGLVKWVGFRQIGLTYEAAVRNHGKSKYSVKKMVKFAVQGITSFSTKPLYIAAYIGIIFALLSTLYIPYIAYSYFSGRSISGWTSLIVTVAFLGGLQLMILGIIGIYLGKLFMQSKHRPNYIIKESRL